MIPPRGPVVEFIGQSSVVEVRIVVGMRPPKNGEGLLAIRASAWVDGPAFPVGERAGPLNWHEQF